MRTYNIKQAQANMEELVAAVEAGEEVIITRWKTPIVRVDPLKPPKPTATTKAHRKFGASKSRK